MPAYELEGDGCSSQVIVNSTARFRLRLLSSTLSHHIPTVDAFALFILDPHAHEIVVQRRVLSSDLLELTYQPMSTGKHQLSIFFNHRIDRQMTIDVIHDESNSLSRLRPFGPGLRRAIAGLPTEFYVDLNQTTNQNIHFRLEPSYQAEIDYEQQMATVRYVPSDEGDCCPVHILEDDRDIPQSPFIARVARNSTMRGKPRIRVFGLPNEIILQRPVEFEVCSTLLCCSSVVHGFLFRRFSSTMSRMIPLNPFRWTFSQKTINRRPSPSVVDIDRLTYVHLFLLAWVVTGYPWTMLVLWPSTIHSNLKPFKAKIFYSRVQRSTTSVWRYTNPRISPSSWRMFSARVSRRSLAYVNRALPMRVVTVPMMTSPANRLSLRHPPIFSPIGLMKITTIVWQSPMDMAMSNRMCSYKTCSRTAKRMTFVLISLQTNRFCTSISLVRGRSVFLFFVSAPSDVTTKIDEINTKWILLQDPDETSLDAHDSLSSLITTLLEHRVLINQREPERQHRFVLSCLSEWAHVRSNYINYEVWSHRAKHYWSVWLMGRLCFSLSYIPRLLSSVDHKRLHLHTVSTCL